MNDRLDEVLKSVLVQFPIADCPSRVGDDPDALSLDVIVRDADGLDDTITIRFRIVIVDQWLDTWLFGNWSI